MFLLCNVLFELILYVPANNFSVMSVGGGGGGGWSF